MADLDKAADKGWEMGMERKAMGKQRENDENDSMDQKLVNKDQMKKMYQRKKKTNLSLHKLLMDNIRQKQEPHSFRM